ncbi:DUF1330 domain-containing protein [Sinimarinibacterium sp. CAU 1509]|uniref:DUF1330 domain-containing protein n=1 Tax=Sinimarinibacterium sp. CAU 1509 TaxID=2562283 RepID=UPI0010AD7B5F|nr:DUF1330 domain-containing protein [Sinimarinibacterium sp. CAU 1509]TJY59023.1 DUF1330 domain-containing protein [Sinimarinibacterium sp. CAU 1509]
MTQTVNPTGADLKRIATSIPMDTPVTMLNLLRFRAEAAYPADSGCTPCSGREAYARYSTQAFGKVREVGGELVYQADAIGRFIGPDGEDWDEVLLVRYPSLQAFLAMVSMPDYQAMTVHRTAALADARLTVTRSPK